MAQDAALLTGGPTAVYVDDGAGDIDIGFTKDGVELTGEIAYMDLITDQLGETIANSVLNGVRNVEVKFNFAQWDLLLIARAFPNSVKLQDDTTATKKAVDFRALAGSTLLSRAKKWTLKPHDPTTGIATTDKAHWVTIWKATPSGPLSQSFSSGNQRVIPVTLRVFPDTSKSNSFFWWGDPTVVDANESGFTALP